VGVRDRAILVGLHAEVSGYDRRLSDFTEYDRARTARREAESKERDELQRPVALAGSVAMETNNQRPLDGPIQAASHSDVYAQPSSVTAAIPTAIPAEQPAVANAVHIESIEGIPLHAGPNGERPPSTEAMIDARRAKIAKEEDNIVSIIAERAMNLMREGEYRRTVNMLSQLVTEHNRSAQMFQLLGEAYYHCDQIQAAEVSLKLSLQLYKNDARANYFMGCTLQKLGDRQRGLHYLLQAHDLDPMYPPIVSDQALAPR
jgi:tetratricopeptide (TPR) repeat protein